ncbi:MAG: response regulator [Thiolinea sp.]
MAKSESVTGICLHQLIAREEAVIKRVIAFSGAQGRNYQLTEMQQAQIVIVSDDTPVDFAALNPQGSMIARITAADSDQPYDVLMARPLLVTRVMRTLDEASALLKDVAGAADEIAEPVVSEPAEDADAPAQPESPVTAEPDAEPDSAGEPSPEQEQTAPVSAAPAETEVSDSPETRDKEQSDEAEETEAVAEAEQTEEEEADSVAAEAMQEGGDDSDALAETDNQTDSRFHHKALVVDDSAAIRKQLELELRDAGISADFAEDGEQALEKVAANRYDLIFLDIIMPGIDGYETCRQLRLRSELKKTPIIMLSAKTSPLDEVQGVIAGASTYLTKPVKSEQLQTTLKRVSMWIDNFQGAAAR